MNSLFKRLIPWYDEEEEQMKDKKVDTAITKGRAAEDRIEKLAEAHKAAAIALAAIRQNTQR